MKPLAPSRKSRAPSTASATPSNDRAATVGTEPVVGHHDQAEHAEENEAQDPETPTREDRPCQQWHQQQGLGLVADSPEARVLGRAEGVHGLPLWSPDHDERIERHDSAIEGEQRAFPSAETGKPGRNEDRARRDGGAKEHFIRDLSDSEGEVDEQRGGHRGHGRAEAEQREGKEDAGDDEESRQLQPVVGADRAPQARQPIDRVVRRCPRERRRYVPPQSGRSDVHDRDKAGNVRRRRCEQAVVAVAHHRDPIQRVVGSRSAAGRQLHDDADMAVREGTGLLGVDERPAFRDAAEARAHLRAAHELREGAATIRRRAVPRANEPDCAALGERRERGVADPVEDVDLEVLGARRQPRVSRSRGEEHHAESDENHEQG